MVTWKPLETALHALRYFQRDWEFLGVAGYFSGDASEDRRERRWRRLATRWHGRAAAALGLSGPVKMAPFQEALEGRVPGIGIRLGRVRRGAPPAPDAGRRKRPSGRGTPGPDASPDPVRQHRPGGDLTFSAPKSVSLEALVYARPRTRARVLRAHDEAVAETLGFVDVELLQTRGHDPATGRRPRVPAHGLVAATFRHLASRDLDPQLHTHAVLLNMTRDAAGEWRSVDFTAIARAKLLIGAVYRTALQRRLEALGYATVPTLVGTTPGFEIAGYPKPLLDHFSQRRRAILDWLERQGHEYSTRTAQLAALVTRRHKQEPGRAELDARWAARARHFGPPRDWEAARGRAGPPPAAVPPALEVVLRAIEHLEERQSVFAVHQLRGWALAHAAGRHDLAALDRAIATLERRAGVLVPAQRSRLDAAYTTRRALAAEAAILAHVRAGIGAGEPLADAAPVTAHLAATRLNAGQRAAAELLLLAPHRVVGVQGHAGSGKTTMLRAVGALAADRPLLALAPSAAATRILGAETGLPARTLQWFLTRYRAVGDGTAGPAELAAARDALAAGLVIVDEASMIGNAAMELLLRIADRAGAARVALVGDRRQLPSVEAGTPFRLLQDRGLPTATMDVILRQRTPGLQAVVQHLLARKPDLAIAGLGADVLEIGGDREGETTAAAAARLWLDLAATARTRTAIVAPTHTERAEIAAVIRAGLADEGVLRGGTLTLDRYVNLHLTRAEKGDPAHYRPGDVAVFHADLLHARVRKDDACAVRAIAGDQVVLGHPDGSERRIRPASQIRYRLELYEPRAIQLRAGDRIRWTRNWRRAALALDNGTLATLTGIDRHRVRLRSDDGRSYSLARGHPQLHHLDYAYSTTVYGAQGMTCDAVIAVLDAGRGAPPDQAALYVELTRARDSAVLLTDDREALVEALEARTGERGAALEAVAARDAAVRPAPAVAAKPQLHPEPIVWEAFAAAATERGEQPFAAPGHAAVLGPVLALAGGPAPAAPAVAHRVATAHRTWAAARERARARERDDLRAALAQRTAALGAYLRARKALPADPVRGGTAAAARDAYGSLLEQAGGAIDAASDLAGELLASTADLDGLDNRRTRLQNYLRAAVAARSRDAAAAACCGRLLSLDDQAAATGRHRSFAPGYRKLVAMTQDLARDTPPSEAMAAVLVAFLADAARIHAASVELRRFMVHGIPAFLRRHARRELDAFRADRGLFEQVPAGLAGTDVGEICASWIEPFVTTAHRLRTGARYQPLLAARPDLRARLVRFEAALVQIPAFQHQAHALLRQLRRLSGGGGDGVPPVLAPGAGRLAGQIARLKAAHRRLPRVPRQPQRLTLPLTALDPGRSPESASGAGEPLAAIPRPLARFRYAYLCAVRRREALRARLATRLGDLEHCAADHRHLLESAARERRPVTEVAGYSDWRGRTRRHLQPDPVPAVPAGADTAGPDPVPEREPLWARVERLRAQLTRALDLDRRTAAASRTAAELERRAASAGVHWYFLADRERLTAMVAHLKAEALVPRPDALPALPPPLAAVAEALPGLPAAAADIRAFVTGTVPALTAALAPARAAEYATTGPPHAAPWPQAANAALAAGERLLMDPQRRALVDASPRAGAWIRLTLDAIRASVAFDAEARRLLARHQAFLRAAPDWQRWRAPDAPLLAAAIDRLAARLAAAPTGTPTIPPPVPTGLAEVDADAGQAYRRLTGAPPAPVPEVSLQPALPASLAAFRAAWQRAAPLVDRSLRLTALIDARARPTAADHRPAIPADGSGARADAPPERAPAADTAPTLPAAATGADTLPAFAAHLRSQLRTLAAALRSDAKLLACRQAVASLDRTAAASGRHRFQDPRYPAVVERIAAVHAARQTEPPEHRPLLGPWPPALAAVRDEAGVLQPAAAAVDAFVAQGVPALLTARARLETTVAARPGLAGLQEDSGYLPWKRDAQAAVREGRTFLTTPAYGVPLDARTGAHAWIACQVDSLDGTLAFDDRAHDVLGRYRDATADDRASGEPAGGSGPDPSCLDALRDLAHDWTRLTTRPPPAAPGVAGADRPGHPPAAPAQAPRPPPPLAGMLADAGQRRRRAFAALTTEDLPRLRVLADTRERLRRAAVTAGTGIRAHADYDRWHTETEVATARVRPLLTDRAAWLEAYQPLPADADATRARVRDAASLLDQARARDRDAAACLTDLAAHADAAVAAGLAPYAGPAYDGIVERVRTLRRQARPGEFPAHLEPVAIQPEAQREAHARVRDLGTHVLPDLEARLEARTRLGAVAADSGCGMTELSDYADWDREAERARNAVADRPEWPDPACALHWETVRRSTGGGAAPARLAVAAAAIDRAVRIDRDARALLADPLRPADPAEHPWADSASAQTAGRYSAYADRIAALQAAANRPGEMPPTLVRLHESFREWQRDRKTVRTHVRAIGEALRRSRELLAETGTDATPFRDADPGRHRLWIEQQRRIHAAGAALMRDRERFRTRFVRHLKAIPEGRATFLTGARTADLLAPLDRLPAGRLGELHDAMERASAGTFRWAGSPAAEAVLHAWHELARTHPDLDPAAPPRAVQNLDAERTLHKHMRKIEFLAQHYRTEGPDRWLVDATGQDWRDEVAQRIKAARAFVDDRDAFAGLRQRFPADTKTLLDDLDTTAAALAADRERQRTEASPARTTHGFLPAAGPGAEPPEPTRPTPARQPPRRPRRPPPPLPPLSPLSPPGGGRRGSGQER